MLCIQICIYIRVRYWFPWKDGTPQLMFQLYTNVRYAGGIVVTTVKK